jgi:phosphoenolpyruvate synthase/pyruvate phosphate dikinase
VQGPQDFGGFRDGDVLVAKATAPAWTPLFARAAAVITDSGSLAAHASLVAREYGIPAVVATGDATVRLHPGQLVTVDGSVGTITPHTEPTADQRDGQRVESDRASVQGQMSTLVLHLHRSPCGRFKTSAQRIVQDHIRNPHPTVMPIS